MRKKYFTRLTSRESVTGLLCLRQQLRQYDSILYFYLEQKFIHLDSLCKHIIDSRYISYEEPSEEFEEIKINSLLLNETETVELDEPWISLHARCIRNQPTEIIDLHNTWWKFLEPSTGADYSYVKDIMNENDKSLKHFPTIKKLVKDSRNKSDYDIVKKLYQYILDNEDDVMSELNSRWLISITQSLCELKKHGHQFVLLFTLMRTIQVYHSKLFTNGVYFKNKDGVVEISHDLNSPHNAKNIPKGGWTVLWDGLQVRFENDHVFDFLGTKINQTITNQLCKRIYMEFINRIPNAVMSDKSKNWLLSD